MASTCRTETVIEVGRLLGEHRGEDIVALDLGEMNSWTDYFVIATVRSAAHLGGLIRALDGFLRERDILALNRHKRSSGDGWVLVDCGFFAVHLMSAEMREFFSLERLYFKGRTIFHSSKSS